MSWRLGGDGVWGGGPIETAAFADRTGFHNSSLSLLSPGMWLSSPPAPGKRTLFPRVSPGASLRVGEVRLSSLPRRHAGPDRWFAVMLRVISLWGGVGVKSRKLLTVHFIIIHLHRLSVCSCVFVCSPLHVHAWLDERERQRGGGRL